MYLTLIILGIFVSTAQTQQLTTKCLNSDWTQFYEKCYLAVNYTLSWPSAYGYCGKYGAKLVEPRGYLLNDAIRGEVASKMPSVDTYWTGFNRPASITGLPAYSGYWSDGQAAGVEVGIWALKQPAVSAGNCAYVNNADSLWYMGSCDRPMPFLCEMDPCPAGDRDTYMCNGKCLGPSLQCDRKNDCGNNMDEQDCANSCSQMLQGSSGTITPATSGGLYLPNANCTWLIHTLPGTRINAEISYVNTEHNTDFLEIYDGGFSLSESRFAVRLSGNKVDYRYKSSLNLMLLRFVSDVSNQDLGFQVSWSTVYACQYTQLQNYKFSNTDIQYRDSLKLTSSQNYFKCQTECDELSACVGFSYESATKTCNFMNMLPILEADSTFSIYSKTCPGYGTVKGSVPLWEPVLTATGSFQQFATPLYPGYYMANTELEYQITASANNRITLEVLTVDLCCGDTVTILDKEKAVLTTLNSDSVPVVLVSTSNTLYVRMDLNTHWKCKGVLMKYKEGCDITMSGSGQFMSPGYGSVYGYGPGLSLCTWTINAPTPDRSVTAVFEEFRLHSSDKVMITDSSGAVTTHTDLSLNGQSVTSISSLRVTLETSARDGGAGFLASFSPGCTTLNAAGYQVNSGGNNYNDNVNLGCAAGYFFTGPNAGQTNIQMTCGLGGIWSIDPVPVCERAYCGPSPLISNGYIVSSSGPQGSDVTQYRCKDGYTLTGSDVITCTASGLWGTRPTCTTTACDDLGTTLPTMTAQVLYGAGTGYNSVSRLSCPIYKEVIGAATVSCQNGAWDFSSDASPSSCRATLCETPWIDNAHLSPTPPYTDNMILGVTCMPGYELSGANTFKCGVDTVLPTCVRKTCSLDVLPSVTTMSSSGQTEYNYGEKVEVTCGSGLHFTNVWSSSIQIECLASGQWNYVPVCGDASCYTPYQVAGSVYTAPCLDHGCSFQFECQPWYERVGTSSFKVDPSQTQGDHIVRCGAINSGLWDFGDHRCIGAQCHDPGYPPSGFLIGDSFEIGATVMFGCHNNGFDPLLSDGTISSGRRCVRDTTTGTLVWDGEMPKCIDVHSPVYTNCPTEDIKIGHLYPPNFVPPSVTDNNAIKTESVFTENFNPFQPLAEATTVYYQATDYADNMALCTVTVKIPDYIVCKNDVSTNYEISSSGTLSGDNAEFYERKNTAADIGVTFQPESISVQTNAAILNKIYEIEVTATNTSTNDVLDSCIIQFRFRAPPCASWSLYVPNGSGNCNNGDCNAVCNEGSFFMEDPFADSIQLTCTDSGWSREPPVCAQSTTNYVIYTANYNYKYFIHGDIFDFETDCRDPYTAEVETRLGIFASDMQAVCNEGNTNNPVIVTFINLVSLNYDIGDRRLYIKFEYQISVTNEAASNTLALKEACANTIHSYIMSAEGKNYQVSNLDGTPTCSGGDFDFISNGPSFAYRCIGNRKFAIVNGNRYCLNCPVGYYYNENNGGNCEKCPVNTYGDPDGHITSVGPTCLACPNGVGPDRTGLTSQDDCFFEAKCKAGSFSTDGLTPCRICPKNFYSAGELSTTCQKCDEDMITLNEGSTSQLDCLTQADAEQNHPLVNTPCNPSPCLNGATCTYVYNTYSCTCPEGFTGRFCDVSYTACSSNPCENGQQCQLSTNGGYICICGSLDGELNEFTGARCEIDVHGCASSYCKNNGTCHNARGSYSCKCTSYGGFNNLETGSCSNPIDQCTADPCDQGVCVPHGTFYRSCDCYPGYTDLDCSTDIDDCVPNLCQNGATCVDEVNGFTCNCLDGYHGDFCQFVKSCDQKCVQGFSSGCNTCDEDGTLACFIIGNSYSCNCMDGYTGTSCEIELSPCNSYPCQHAGTCVKVTDTEFTCECAVPWIGDTCDTEIDNCVTGNECQNGGTCYSSATRHVCSCPSGFIGEDCSETYDLCSRADPCVSEGSTCSFSDGSFTCTCEEGYTGDSCQTAVPSCSDIVCNYGGNCYSDNNGVPACSCMEGYDGTTCDINIDECASNPCSTGLECQDGVNSYTCTCGVNKRGENCDKAVDANFDYVIFPTSLCREDASRSRFGDGQTEIQALTVSFWIRYTALHGRGSVLSIFATHESVENIPTNPQFKITFDSTQMVAEYTSPSTGRKKREVDSRSDFNYPSLADGYWWHVAVTWDSSSGEITLYINGTLIDQEFFANGSSLGTRGFMVFGDWNPLTGSSNETNSLEGRISHLFVVDQTLVLSDIQQLLGRNLNPSNQVLYQQRTTMLQYSVDYNSELHPTVEKCIRRTDASCDINAAISLPEVTSCPGDVLTITGRQVAPTWVAPIFFGIYSPISTISSGAQLDWGLYGVSYAVFDTDSNAALCTFRVYNRETSCVQGGGDASCVNNNGMYRCESSCGSTQGWPGIVPLYLTCSMYGMWDQADRSTTYIKPKCSDTFDITSDVTLELTARTSVDCSSIVEEYKTSVFSKLNTFNAQAGNSLCTPTCFAVVTSTSISCLDASTAKISFNFGQISPTMTLQGSSVTVEEAFQIAVGDDQVFAYASTSDSSRTVAVDVASVDVTSTPACAVQYQISGDTCVSCGAGTSYDAATSTCVRCQKGTYSDSTLTTCTSCPAGRTTVSDGATSSSDCKERCFRGQYFDSQDLQSCRDCPRGYYQDSLGAFSCKPCSFLYTTVGEGSQFATSCVAAASLSTPTTTLPPPGPNFGGSKVEEPGLGTGVIVAIVLGVLIGLLILILIIVFCCCKGAVPCLSKKKQVVSPVGKEGYYANKYGELDMRFVSYNLKDVREKKGRPLDKEPIYEPPLSDDTGSLKTDISIHVPVFNEKMNGSVTKKSLYMSNGGQHMNSSFTRSQRSTARDPTSARGDQIVPHIIAPLTSSPRSMNQYLYENEEEVEHYHKPKSKRRKRKGHKHRSSGHHEREDVTYEADLDVSHQPLPKALSPLPIKVKSKAPADVFMRPASPMNRPRTEVLPSQYEDFLGNSPVRSLGRSRDERSLERSRGERSRDERSLDRSRGERSLERSRGERSRSARSLDRSRRERSRDERSFERSRDERSFERSRGERSHHSPRTPKVQHMEDQSGNQGMMRIEVESDEDLR